ncbi:hypothetical protein QYF61_016947 [Mycteria americana]|uniref:Uncharacterized protein n=1 Tax=Mycteria americana TaxID=33587 RepID=A0AAN7SAM4_MYCAM|nr:hypothetical protein QYF61_016947 [Mycteria americana]
MECILSKLTDDTTLVGNTDTLKGSGIFQKGLSGLEKWADRDFIKFKGNCQVLHLGKSKSMQQYKLGAIWIESSPAENDVENLLLSSIRSNIDLEKLNSQPAAKFNFEPLTITLSAWQFRQFSTHLVVHQCRPYLINKDVLGDCDTVLLKSGTSILQLYSNMNQSLVFHTQDNNENAVTHQNKSTPNRSATKPVLPHHFVAACSLFRKGLPPAAYRRVRKFQRAVSTWMQKEEQATKPSQRDFSEASVNKQPGPGPGQEQV